MLRQGLVTECIFLHNVSIATLTLRDHHELVDCQEALMNEAPCRPSDTDLSCLERLEPVDRSRDQVA